MMAFLEAIHDSAFPTWLRGDSYFPYTFILALHALGLAFLVGTNAAIDLRILGIAPRLPLKPMEKFFRVMWLGFCVNAVSGVALLVSDPPSFLTNWVFYVKLTAIAFAVWNIRLLQTEVFGNPANLGTSPVSTKGKMLAVTSLTAWFVAILAGRTSAYVFSTADHITLPLTTARAVIIVIAVMLLVRYSVSRLLPWNKSAAQTSEERV